MELQLKASVMLVALATVGGIFATPAQGQVTIFSETYSASGGTATDNTYTVISGSPATVSGGQQDFSGGLSAIIQSPDGAASAFSLSDPITVSFDFIYAGPPLSNGIFFAGMGDASGTPASFGLIVRPSDTSPFVGAVVANGMSSGIEFVDASGLTAATTYAVSATFTPGGTPGTTDVIYSMIATAGPGGDITTGTAATLTEAISPGLATFASGAISGEGNFFIDNILVTGTAPPASGLPATTYWGLALTALALTLGGMLAVGRLQGRRSI